MKMRGVVLFVCGMLTLMSCGKIESPSGPDAMKQPTLSVVPDTIVRSGTASAFATDATTLIMFFLPYAQHVRVAIDGSDGRMVALLVDEYLEAGTYEVSFNASQLSTGMYVALLDGDLTAHTWRMLLIK